MGGLIAAPTLAGGDIEGQLPVNPIGSGPAGLATAEASLTQAKASRRQNKANRELARVTWGRDPVLVKEGWVTRQQGDQVVLTPPVDLEDGSKV